VQAAAGQAGGGDVTGIDLPRICVLGLGEAGAAIATDLVAAGVEVHGYDPAAVGPPAGAADHEHPATTTAGSAEPAGVLRYDDPKAAVASADVILAITLEAHAMAALRQVIDAIPLGAIYADLSTSSAGLKRELAGVATAAGVGFVDVALMSPVPGHGLATPALASGPAVEAFVATMVPLGMPVEAAGDEPGQAATRKLLRSVVMKGLAALIIESLRAAEAAGLTAETWDNLVAQLSSIDGALVQRLVTGTGRHAPRRVDEMVATVELLTELGVEPIMSRATLATLRQLADKSRS
jgi:3-hydroxyisobutyrate dehydrogenase-like beta-hydroxyacid dehydrogenase